MAFRLVELVMDDGASPYKDWFDSLDAVAAAKVTTALLRIEQGNVSNVKWFRGIGEYRIDWGPGYRVYFAKDGLDVIVLLGGGTKRTQQNDVDYAIELWRSYKRRKAAESRRR